MAAYAYEDLRAEDLHDRATPEWPADKLALLIELRLKDELSFSAIGKRVGKTKNACIGVAHRRGLPRQSRPERAAKKKRDRRGRVRSRPVRPPKIAKVEVRRLDRAEIAAALALPGQETRMERLGAHQCRWPVGDPKHADFAFCARPHKPAAGPYCEAHAAVAIDRQKTQQAARGGVGRLSWMTCDRSLRRSLSVDKPRAGPALFDEPEHERASA